MLRGWSLWKLMLCGWSLEVDAAWVESVKADAAWVESVEADAAWVESVEFLHLTRTARPGPKPSQTSLEKKNETMTSVRKLSRA